MIKKHPITMYCFKRDLSKKDFAKMAGISYPTIVNMTIGIRYPTRYIAKMIHDFTDGKVSMHDLYTWEANEYYEDEDE